MSSTSGTMPTVKNGLSSQEVCAIITSCATNNVSVLKFGELYLRFGPTAEEQPKSESAHPKTPDTAISEQQHEKQNEQTLEYESELTREEQLANALVENPLLHEELLRNGELEDDADDEPGDE